MKIVCDNKIPFLQGVFEPYAKVEYLPGGAISAADIVGADALVIRTRTRCDRNLLEHSSVRAIATATIGYDHIDSGFCAQNHISWSNVPGCNSGSVQQYVLAALCRLSQMHGFSLSGKTLGIVGVGHVGSKVAAAASALGMKTLLCDPPRALKEGSSAFVSLEEIVRSSDIITLHVPLQQDTFHLLDPSLLSANQFIINSSRGEVLDNQALRACLEKSSIAGAVLDVWENEPEIDRELLQLCDIATPHIAGYSADGKAAGTAGAVRFIAKQLGIKDLEHFAPAALPQAGCSLISAPAGIGQAILQTYDIERDSQMLKSSPQSFERLRSDYPVRREMFAFSISGADAQTNDIAKELGFKIL